MRYFSRLIGLGAFAGLGKVNSLFNPLADEAHINALSAPHRACALALSCSCE
jgi:hypothetical protein